MRKPFGIIVGTIFIISLSICCTDAEQPTDQNESEISSNEIDYNDLEYATDNYPLIGDCYLPTGFTVRSGPEFIYWFARRPRSYDAYLWQWKVRADEFPRGVPNGTGVTVQKRDMLWCCSLNPWIGLRALRLCEK